MGNSYKTLLSVFLLTNSWKASNGLLRGKRRDRDNGGGDLNPRGGGERRRLVMESIVVDGKRGGGSDNTYRGLTAAPIGAPPNNFANSPTAPTPAPTTSTPKKLTYRPGEKTVLMEGLSLSTGLHARKIATTNTTVQYANGGWSLEAFHSAPDAAAIFEDPTTGDYVYASNSESSLDGGVGSIRFNARGEVIGYQRLLFRDPVTGDLSKTRTARNCGVGKTYWNTLITCEEWDQGRVWEVDPWGNQPGRMTTMVAQGRAYESAAYDNRDVNHPVFYITTDESNGPLVRYTPDPAVVAAARSSGDYSQVLHSPGGRYAYFVVTTVNTQNGDTTGTYKWTTDVNEGNASASAHHRHGEGIDIRNGQLYYTAKAQKYLFIIDLDSNRCTFVVKLKQYDDDSCSRCFALFRRLTSFSLLFLLYCYCPILLVSRSSTASGAFDSNPDQIARVLDFSNGSTDGILYFCEDGEEDCGVHGRDAQGRFFTILEDGTGALSGETTGLAFSPNGMFMYVSFQKPGIIFEISRTDGRPFYGATLDIKYHANSGPDSFRERRTMRMYDDNVKTCEFNAEMC
jgi:hypothetical protein